MGTDSRPEPTTEAATVRPRPGLLHEIFEQQAAANPNRTAVICGAQTINYGALERRANQLTSCLRAGGVEIGDRIGLLAPRSSDAYIGLLGILKAGAAYVPLDPEYPADRVNLILADCQAKALVASSDLAQKAATFQGRKVLLDEKGMAQPSAPPFERAPTTPEDLCYVIYTSGSTGKPKGVEITHRSACHLVEAEAEIFKVRPEDRVFQGASLAFDASVEEIWLAFRAGATLVVGTAEMVHAGPALAGMLTKAGVTVLSCVPTLLLMMEEDIPSLRLLILGGEACPPGLVKRWWRPQCRVVNTYGPTEATVIATWSECHPDKPVTIGRPVANYLLCVVNESLDPVPVGEAGELCIGGIGLARGYIGRPELTREKFVEITSPRGTQPSDRFYRTGDLARWNADAELEFLGRIDTQVKIRGFRVELGEIEALLLESPNIKAAAVALREDVPGVQQLVAYLVPAAGAQIDVQNLRAALREKLPPYMVPAILEILPALPVLTSGKVDRKSLPAPKAAASESAREIIEPRTALEQQIAQVWGSLFSPQPVSIRDDFFLELGGHSLLAARMISALRKRPRLEGISVLDIYQHRTIEGLAKEVERRNQNSEFRNQEQDGAQAQVDSETRPLVVPFWRHFLCGTAQLISLFFVLSFFALQWLAPYLTYTILIEEEYDFAQALLGAFASLILFYPVMLMIPILLKWLVIGRYRPGAYPLWGAYFFRWWLVTTIEAAVPVGYLTGTPLLNLYARLMGGKIGKNVYLGSENFAIYDLLSIGEGSSVNADANLLGYTIEDGWLKIGSITIGKNCFVGGRAAIRQETIMEDGAALEDLSLLSRSQRIPARETWKGSPAVPTGSAGVPAGAFPNSQPRSRLNRLTFTLLHAIGLLTFPVLVVAALFPGIVVMNELNYLDPYYWYLLLAPLVGLSFVFFLALEIAAVKWLLLGRVKPGRYRLNSWFYFRKWFVDQTMDLSLDVLGPLYASVYLTPWYKLLGAKLGRGAEVSTASFISPDLLTIGQESFIADNVSLGAPRVRDGEMTIGTNQIGQRSFVGNSAMLPPDTVLGDRVLLGCLSLPPAPPDALREDTTWLGSPSILVPERQKTPAFGEEATFDPPARLRVLRATIEFVRVIAPSTGFIVLTSLLFSALLLLRDYFSLTQTLLFFPFLYIGCGLTATLFTIIAKWLLVGRYRPGEKPLWSSFIWRNELLNALHEHLAEPFLVGALTGTPFVCWYFRLHGARIGRRVYMETTDFSEFDLTRIGDQAALNADCTIQTHLFEDRVMKMSTVDIGPRCNVGAGSLVLYDTRMEERSSLGDLSLLMKGEVLPRATRWEGVPARRVSG
jgi:non-ribosomal peptide synthetase-like protein